MNCLSNLPIEYQVDFIETDFKEILVRICLERYANIERVVFTSVSFICQNADIPMKIETAILYSSYVRKTLQKLVDNQEIVHIRGHIIENEQQAYGFCGSIDAAVRILGLNRKTVDACLASFVEHGLLVKHVTGSCYVKGKPKNVLTYTYCLMIMRNQILSHCLMN